jgi:hypothetical protein
MKAPSWPFQSISYSLVVTQQPHQVIWAYENRKLIFQNTIYILKYPNSHKSNRLRVQGVSILKALPLLQKVQS